MTDIESRIVSLDTTLFDRIHSQSTVEDKRSFLLIQKAVRGLAGSYSYLEIGSHLGGTIQPYLIDPLCTHIYSIDKRPPVQPDDRGFEFTYPENSTARMLGLLRQVSLADVAKVECFEDDARNINTSRIIHRPSICLIDGEHTESAVLSDFDFCRSVVARQGVICFHDSNVVFTALQKIVARLQTEQVAFNAYVLPLHVFVIELGGLAIHRDADVSRVLINNHSAYLAGLTANDYDRSFYHHWLINSLHRVWRRIQRPR